MRSACLILALICGGATQAADVPDLTKVDRHIAKEPAYKSKEPLYGLYVFGPDARTRVWAVFDKSKPDAKHYDILYFDRNADGDLTAADERIEGQGSGGDMTFPIGSFTDPITGQKHTELSISRRTG